ncbi:MAG TPA: aminotransferase class V-fold PLP-dependent enzyme [Thermoanaerobaculia bacterium]|nr:aminotransferase class V-fold PLP-dependent enzyme [Thermoanaerobaculia bacterium]
MAGMVGTGDDDAQAAAVARWRSDTPGCEGLAHLNNAGAALAPAEVLETVRQHLAREAEIGGYEAADEAADHVVGVYEAVGGLIGAPARNVAVVESATRGVAQALGSFAWQAGDRIVTSRADYPSNQIMYVALGRRFGVETAIAAELPEGGVDPESVRELARHPRCRLVSLSWIPTSSGLVQAAQQVGEVCAAAGVPFLVDACQAVGQMAIDVGSLQCDFLTASARKFLRGPRGIGFLYVSDAALARGAHPLFPDMRGATWTAPEQFRLADGAQRFENWELPYALVLGMGAAARYAVAVGAAGPARTWRLAAGLRARLESMPWARVLDRGAERCALVSIAIAGWDAAALKLRLRERGFNTSSANRQTDLLDMEAKGVTTILRVSPHYYNTEQELDSLLEALAELAAAPPADPPAAAPR